MPRAHHRAPEMASAGGCKSHKIERARVKEATETLLDAETCSHGPVSRPIITSHSSRSSNGAPSFALLRRDKQRGATVSLSFRLVQFVLVQFLRVRGFGNTRALGRDRSALCIQREMHAIKSAEHGYRVIAPQSAVTPNDLLGYAYNPARHMGIAAVDKLPALPVFISSWRARLIRVVIRAATELFFVTIVLFAGEKGSAAHVLPYIGLEGPVLIRA